MIVVAIFLLIINTILFAFSDVEINIPFVGKIVSVFRTILFLLPIVVLFVTAFTNLASFIILLIFSITGAFTGVIIKEKKPKGIVVQCIVILLFLFLSTGVVPRVIDKADQISSINEYIINCEFFMTAIGANISNNPDGCLYLITINPGEEDFVQNKIESIKGYYFVLVLTYDGDELIHTEQYARAPGGAYNITNELHDYISKSSLDKCVQGLPEKMTYAVNKEGEVTYDIDNGPGVHWVNGYTRQDGTEVEGYLRSNPDGDPTNNLEPHSWFVD